MQPNILKTVLEQLPSSEIGVLLNPDPLLCMAIKTQDEGYVYANQNFLKLMGFSHLKDFIHLYDKDLYSDKKLLTMYKEHDEAVYISDEPLKVQGEIAPDRQNKLVKTMEGLIYPLHIHKSKPDAVLIMHKPTNGIVNLSPALLLNTCSEKLAKSLKNNSYPVRYKDLTISLARMEILCLAELLKGKTAGKTAETLGLKTLTVESYLTNLKDKCGVGMKCDLVKFFIDSQLLESIVV